MPSTSFSRLPGSSLTYFLVNVIGRKFDPFSPVWLFLVGYVQVYIIQALSYQEWALRIRGQDLVAAANFRALWALVWFLLVYHLGLQCPVGPRAASASPQMVHARDLPRFSPPHSLGTLLRGSRDQGGIPGGGYGLSRRKPCFARFRS